LSAELIVVLIVSFGVPSAALSFFCFKFWQYERSVTAQARALSQRPCSRTTCRSVSAGDPLVTYDSQL